jgi:hypothetical protein
MASSTTFRRLHIAWGFSDDIFNPIWFNFWLFRFWGHFHLVVPGIYPVIYIVSVLFRASRFVRQCLPFSLLYFAIFWLIYLPYPKNNIGGYPFLLFLRLMGCMEGYK